MRGVRFRRHKRVSAAEEGGRTCRSRLRPRVTQTHFSPRKARRFLYPREARCLTTREWETLARTLCARRGVLDWPFLCKDGPSKKTASPIRRPHILAHICFGRKEAAWRTGSFRVRTERFDAVTSQGRGPRTSHKTSAIVEILTGRRRLPTMRFKLGDLPATGAKPRWIPIFPATSLHARHHVKRTSR